MYGCFDIVFTVRYDLRFTKGIRPTYYSDLQQRGSACILMYLNGK